MKVLHIFGMMNRGGAEMRTLEIMPHLRQKGIHFNFCTLGEGTGDLDEIIRQNGGQVFNCPLSVGLRRFSRSFQQLLRSEGYDAVHSHVYYFSGKVLQLARRAGTPMRIAHFRTLHDGKDLTWKRKLYHAYMKHLINRHATDILAVCKGVMASSWKNWKTDARCRVIYNGVNLSNFENLPDTRSEVCKELGIPNGHKILIHVGSFQTAKAHDVLLDAMAQVVQVQQKVVLILVGGGTLKEEMIQRARALKIDKYVRFLGLRSDVPRLLKAADCFVLSSRREGLPGVVIEALAANLPVLATDLPGLHEIAALSGNVRLVPVEQSTALSKSAVQILTDIENHTFRTSPFPAAFKLSNCVDAFYEMYRRKG